jgi:hypothetical protein
MEHRNEKPAPSSRQRGLLAAPRNLESAQAQWGLFRSALWRSTPPTGTAPLSRRAARRTSQSGSISPCSDGPLMPASLADVK